MPDPFSALSEPVVPVDPDPTFAHQLRAQIERALQLPKGVIVSDVALSIDPGLDEPIRQGDLGYVSLWVPDVSRAVDFYSAVLRWRFSPSSGPENRGVEGLNLSHGLSGGHDQPTLFLCYCVDDLDEALERVKGAGGAHEEPAVEEYGRIAMGTDVEGTAFALYQPPPGPREARPAVNGTNHGDVSYVTMFVRSSEAVRAFYGSVLGWEFSAGHAEDGWGPDDVAPMLGLQGGHDVPRVRPMYRVDDIEEAVAQVRAHGGTANDPEVQPYGITSECVDDQGTEFYLGQH